MTSRTNRRSGGPNQSHRSEGGPADLEQRRHLAIKRYLDGDPIEAICQEMSCSKSWLYKWKDRYRVDDPTWAQEVSRRPTTSPAKLSTTLEEKIVHLRQTAGTAESGPASAATIRQALKDTGVEVVPSRRTIYRILQRHEKEVTDPPSMP